MERLQSSTAVYLDRLEGLQERLDRSAHPAVQLKDKTARLPTDTLVGVLERRPK
jgi:hypothetical protein